MVSELRNTGCNLQEDQPPGLPEDEQSGQSECDPENSKVMDGIL